VIGQFSEAFYKIKTTMFYLGGVDYHVNEWIFCGGSSPRNKEVCDVLDFKSFQYNDKSIWALFYDSW
jgi:hypothetical protein